MTTATTARTARTARQGRGRGPVTKELTRATATAAIITLAFAAPATVRLYTGTLAPTEPRLSDALASALGGVTLPIVAAATVVTILTGPLRTRADRLVAAGAEPRPVIARPLLLAMAGAAAGSALAGALTVLLIRLSLELGTGATIAADLAATSWAMILGAAAWSALSAVFVIRSGRPARAWIVVGIDLLTRLIPGALAWLAPSAHVANVLGAPPPRGFVHVPVMPQLASVATLIVIAAFATLLAMRRYHGPPSR